VEEAKVGAYHRLQEIKDAIDVLDPQIQALERSGEEKPLQRKLAQERNRLLNESNSLIGALNIRASSTRVEVIKDILTGKKRSSGWRPWFGWQPWWLGAMLVIALFNGAITLSKKFLSAAKCNPPAPSDPQTQSPPNASTALSGTVVGGYACAVGSLIVLPPLLGLAGVICGVVAMKRNESNHAIGVIIGSFVCAAIGMVLSAIVNT
jgi:hypothetical protein